MPCALYLDDDVESLSLAAAVRAASIDVLRSTDAGMRGRDDESHLVSAHQEHRVLFTANRRDFARLHTEFLANGRHHSGIIILTDQRLGIGAQCRELVRILVQYSEAQMVDRLEWLNWRVSDA